MPRISMIPKNQISGKICAWRGCTATFKGETPPGWMNLLTYWAPRPKPRLDFLRDRMRWDGVLCPAHNLPLEALLKARPGGGSRGHRLAHRGSPSLTPSPPRIQTLRGIRAKFLPEPPREALRDRRWRSATPHLIVWCTVKISPGEGPLRVARGPSPRCQ
jgi:hypothetical protein